MACKCNNCRRDTYQFASGITQPLAIIPATNDKLITTGLDGVAERRQKRRMAEQGMDESKRIHEYGTWDKLYCRSDERPRPDHRARDIDGRGGVEGGCRRVSLGGDLWGGMNGERWSQVSTLMGLHEQLTILTTTLVTLMTYPQATDSPVNKDAMDATKHVLSAVYKTLLERHAVYFK
ncbi:hypothetical protein HDU93_008682 [Gonapodya sp. JEL0774]|nr:hypothetical protein HDU93_008682 [Gonapodya sp. JEL0774]